MLNKYVRSHFEAIVLNGGAAATSDSASANSNINASAGASKSSDAVPDKKEAAIASSRSDASSVMHDDDVAEAGEDEDDEEEQQEALTPPSSETAPALAPATSTSTSEELAASKAFDSPPAMLFDMNEYLVDIAPFSSSALSSADLAFGDPMQSTSSFDAAFLDAHHQGLASSPSPPAYSLDPADVSQARTAADLSSISFDDCLSTASASASASASAATTAQAQAQRQDVFTQQARAMSPTSHSLSPPSLSFSPAQSIEEPPAAEEDQDGDSSMSFDVSAAELVNAISAAAAARQQGPGEVVMDGAAAAAANVTVDPTQLLVAAQALSAAPAASSQAQQKHNSASAASPADAESDEEEDDEDEMPLQSKSAGGKKDAARAGSASLPSDKSGKASATASGSSKKKVTVKSEIFDEDGDDMGSVPAGIPASMRFVSDDLRPSPEEYKKLSSKEKRQLRNKISARNFRNRRKEYITTLEEQLQDKDDAMDELTEELEKLKVENEQLKKEVQSLKASSADAAATAAAAVAAPAVASRLPASTTTTAAQQAQALLSGVDINKIVDLLQRNAAVAAAAQEAAAAQQQDVQMNLPSRPATPLASPRLAAALARRPSSNSVPQSSAANGTSNNGSNAASAGSNATINTKKDIGRGLPGSSAASSFWGGATSSSRAFNSGHSAGGFTSVHTTLLPPAPDMSFLAATAVAEQQPRLVANKLLSAPMPNKRAFGNEKKGADIVSQLVGIYTDRIDEARKAAFKGKVSELDSPVEILEDGLPSYDEAVSQPPAHFYAPVGHAVLDAAVFRALSHTLNAIPASFSSHNEKLLELLI